MEAEPIGRSLAEIYIQHLQQRRDGTARQTQRVYFGSEISQKGDMGEYSEIQPALCRKITQVLNETLQEGSAVVVMDFPFAKTGQDFPRVHIITRCDYLRQIAVPSGLSFAKFELGFFSVRLTKIENPKVGGVLNLGILDKFSKIF